MRRIRGGENEMVTMKKDHMCGTTFLIIVNLITDSFFGRLRHNCKADTLYVHIANTHASTNPHTHIKCSATKAQKQIFLISR